MSTYSLDNLKADLQDKQKTVDDLVRFISNRNDNNPNYSLLLGAGCSVNSDIRSAAKLMNEWKEEIYKAAKPDQQEPYTPELAVEYFKSNNHVWYDPNNQYSSLFERRYDLPKQRRAFVEKEVRNKTPSIGYAYLVKLIESSYFKTIFTTNFDDLINQSFYDYSNHCRPIVCAHDSSINSITITSSRPKIIKLHGDYLFDDIKST